MYGKNAGHAPGDVEKVTLQIFSGVVVVVHLDLSPGQATKLAHQLLHAARGYYEGECVDGPVLPPGFWPPEMARDAMDAADRVPS